MPPEGKIGDYFAYRGSITFKQVSLMQIKNLSDTSMQKGIGRQYEYGLYDTWHGQPTQKKTQFKCPTIHPDLKRPDNKKINYTQAWDIAEKIRIEDETEDRETKTALKRCTLKRQLISDLHFDVGIYFEKPGQEIEGWFNLGGDENDDKDTRG